MGATRPNLRVDWVILQKAAEKSGYQRISSIVSDSEESAKVLFGFKLID